jgi:ribosomal protein S18 acetylase RimI-like enzyme
MSVAADRRRRGIGRIILRELLRQVESLGVRSVVLETAETWHDVIRFYFAHGFNVTHHADGNIHFSLQIGE